MEEKIKLFKSKRRKEILINKTKTFFQERLEKFFLNFKSVGIVKKFIFRENFLTKIAFGSEVPSVSWKKEALEKFSVDTTQKTESLLPSSNLTKVVYLLYFLLWVIIYLIAIQLEFGFLYFILSALISIYCNTRTGPKKKGEISAYSVFNPGCEAIQGTLKAEQLEKEFNLIQH